MKPTPSKQGAVFGVGLALGGWLRLLAVVFTAVLMLRLLWSVELGRELLAKSLMTITGYLGTPFVLEASFFILGWVAVLTWNEHRRGREGPDWVQMNVEEPKSDGHSSAAPGQATRPSAPTQGAAADPQIGLNTQATDRP